jgi:outer membrane immunogenic protein
MWLSRFWTIGQNLWTLGQCSSTCPDIPYLADDTNQKKIEVFVERKILMHLTKSTLALLGRVVLSTFPVLAQFSALAQDEGYRSDASVQAFGSFLKETVDNGVPQNATHSGGVLASYRYFFNKHHGVELNYGHALNTQRYGLSGGLVGVRADSHEATAAYVLRFPLGKLSPFVLAGAGGLVFDPKDALGVGSQARAAFVYGGGADYNLTRRIYFRAQYRGLVYNSPDFGLSALSGLDRVTHRAAPSAGFGFRF